MYETIFQNLASPGRAYGGAFGGLNRSSLIADGEFSWMENMSSDGYPFLSPSRMREVVCAERGIEAVIAPKFVPDGEIWAFTGVAGDRFFYNGEAVLTLETASSPRRLVDMNGNILIFPDKKYYSYVDGSSGSMTDEMSGRITYSNETLEGETVSSTLVCAAGFGGRFAKGDSLSIVCAARPENSTVNVTSKYDHPSPEDILSCVVSEVVSGTTLRVCCYRRDGERTGFAAGSYESTVSRAMPDIVYACVANNRVFGVDGKGEYIFASKLGDFKNWNVFEGLSTDSWYGAVATDGPFTGIAAMGNGVVAFKHHYIHQLYGDSPSNFTLARQISGGCIDAGSIAEISGQLFFLGYGGVYTFSGGNPVCVSEALGRRYVSGCAGSDGEKYYLSARTESGETELVVLDTRRGLWHREDDFAAVGFVRYGRRFYAADCDTVFEVGAGRYAKKWSAVSMAYDDGTMENRALIQLYLRVRFLEEDARLAVYSRTDGGEWTQCGEVYAQRGEVARVPVRFRPGTVYQWRIDGEGGATVTAAERVVTATGRNERPPSRL